MNDKQQRRSDILCQLRDDVISIDQAGMLLGRCRRHAERLLARYESEGMASVVHGNAGRIPANKTSEVVRELLPELAGSDGVYHDFNTCHLQEMLAEHEGIHIGRSTLDRLLVQDGVRRRRKNRRRRVYRQRDRCPKQGDMLLTDGSQHDWLEGRDARYRHMCLLGSIDDASSMVVHLRFWPTECQAGYIRMAREVVLNHGVPMRFYHDRHTILCSPKTATIEDELAGREPQSQFEAIVAQLGTESIKALTPQAKGRVERLWRTLQDRLVKEMRLAGVRSLEEANTFLPGFIQRHNARFSVPAQDPDSAWVGASDLDLPFYFAVKEQRTVRSDHTVSWMGATLRIHRRRGEPCLAGTTVHVHTTPEGELVIYAGKQRLVHTALKTDAASTKAASPRQAEPTPPRRSAAKPPHKPSETAGSRAWLFAQT